MKSSSSCSLDPNPGSGRSSVRTSLIMITSTSPMFYTEQTSSLSSHLTCRESIPALSATSLPSIPRPNWYHKRKERWEKNGAKLLEKKCTNSLMPTSSEKSDIPLGSPIFTWSKRPTTKWRMCTDYIDLNRACPKDA